MNPAAPAVKDAAVKIGGEQASGIAKEAAELERRVKTGEVSLEEVLAASRRSRPTIATGGIQRDAAVAALALANIDKQGGKITKEIIGGEEGGKRFTETIDIKTSVSEEEREKIHAFRKQVVQARERGEKAKKNKHDDDLHGILEDAGWQHGGHGKGGKGHGEEKGEGHAGGGGATEAHGKAH